MAYSTNDVVNLMEQKDAIEAEIKQLMDVLNSVRHSVLIFLLNSFDL